MNYTAIKLQPTGCVQGAAVALYGACPNCDRTLPVAASGCPHCRAIFDDSAAWRVLPDASREPGDGSALSGLPARVDVSSGRTAPQPERPEHSLACEILTRDGVVTLEEQHGSFSPAAAVLQVVFGWGYISFHILWLASSLSEAAFHIAGTALLWLSPVAVVAMYHLESAGARWEIGLQKVLLDLPAGELTIECRLIGQTENRWRRVPLADLRLAAQLDVVCEVDGEGFQSQRGPSISLLVPGDLPEWPALSYSLINGNLHDSESAAATYATLLARTGIPPLTTPAAGVGEAA